MDIVVHNYLFDGELLLKEVVHFFGKVKNDSDAQNEHYREEERTKELLDNIPIQCFQSRVIICGKMASFHALKSPARMCLRASVTRFR